MNDSPIVNRKLGFIDEGDGLSGKLKGLRLLDSLGLTVPAYTYIPSQVPSEQIEHILEENFYGPGKKWAVRSSANIEDGVNASFAGQFESIIGIKPDEILDSILKVRESTDSDWVKEYCELHGIDHESIRMDVIIQEFEEPLVSGVWIGNRDGGGILEWVEGRGSRLVNGEITPNVETYDKDGTSSVECRISGKDGVTIADICRSLTNELGYPLDLEFCITDTGLKWLQLRPATSDVSNNVNNDYEQMEVFLRGQTVSSVTARGVSHRFDTNSSEGWSRGLILVAHETNQSMMKYIMTSSGVVTEVGGTLSHAAIVCRELGKACVTGVDIKQIPHGFDILVDGRAGLIYMEIDSNGKL